MRDDMPSAETAALPTRAEFALRLASDRRRVYWAMGLSVGLLLLLFAGMACSVGHLNRAGVLPGTAERDWPLFAAFPIAIAILIGGISWADRRTQTKCPACRQSLFTAQDPYVAMVTGRCPKCAAPMFADDVHDFDAQQTNRRAPVTGREALREVRQYLHQFRPAIPWVIAGALLTLLGNNAEQLPGAEYFASLLGDVWTEFLKRMSLAPGVFVGSLGLWACVRAINVNAEPCPACGEKIGGWSRNTGNCASCGLPVVVDPFPGLQPRDAVAARLRPVDAYRTAARRRHSRQWIGCLIGGGLALLWCTPMLVYLSQQPKYFMQTGWEMAGITVTFVGLGVFQCLGLWWWDRRLAQGLDCPACRRELLHFYPLVVSSQRCRHCGCQVLETPVPKAAV